MVSHKSNSQLGTSHQTESRTKNPSSRLSGSTSKSRQPTKLKKRIRKKSGYLYGRAWKRADVIEDRGAYARTLGAMLCAGFPEQKSRQLLFTLGEVFATANQSAVRRLFSRLERLGRRFPKPLRSTWEMICRSLPRAPAGRPRSDDVTLAESMWKQGMADSQVGQAIYGEVNWKQFMTPPKRRMALKRLRDAIGKRSKYRRVKRRQNRSGDSR